MDRLLDTRSLESNLDMQPKLLLILSVSYSEYQYGSQFEDIRSKSVMNFYVSFQVRSDLPVVNGGVVTEHRHFQNKSSSIPREKISLKGLI